MQKTLTKILTTTAVFSFMLSAFPALGASEQKTERITLEAEVLEEDVLVDLGWKTEQDKGLWIEEMGIAQDAKSLIFIINNLEQNTEESFPVIDPESGQKKTKREQEAGNSRLMYLSKTEQGEWKENFSVNCYVSGGAEMEPDEIYGAYRLESAFGSLDNPGSLVPYHHLSIMDFWTTDLNEENFGSIVSFSKKQEIPDSYVNLVEMKAFSNYGMILKPEAEYEAYPALIVNCQQDKTFDRTFPGVQIAQSYVRILMQSIDQDTRILIVGEVDELDGM